MTHKEIKQIERNIKLINAIKAALGLSLVISLVAAAIGV